MIDLCKSEKEKSVKTNKIDTNRGIYDYLYELCNKEYDKLLSYSKNYMFEKNPAYEKEYEEITENIYNLKTIKSVVLSVFMGRRVINTSFGSYIVDSNEIYFAGVDKTPNLHDYSFEGISECWEIYKLGEKVVLIFIPYSERLNAMKEFILYDNYEGVDIIGEFDTMKEVIATAKTYDSDTDGECYLSLKQLDNEDMQYKTIKFKY